eukprot:TRINITY_DN7054_c0_g1_i4.p1 TRINITY_DN7054_c0_g1~~TRINITY_DN7054_c0_g1_i4.p1  ORF type:complete len:649 (-),score=120.77 TRINITY_DN7054_c0_g1_i4:764-2710(-)
MTVSPKLVENVGMLMDCLKAISNSKAFLNEAPLPKFTQQKNGKEKKGGKSKEVPRVENLPQWFSPAKGGTIYEWICAFLEQLITTKYHQHMNSAPQNNSRAQLYAPPNAFSDFKNLVAFWKTLKQPDKIKVIEEYKSSNFTLCIPDQIKLASIKVKSYSQSSGEDAEVPTEEENKQLLLYAALHADPSQFIDTLFFPRLHLLWQPVIEYGCGLLESIRTAVRDSIARSLLEDEASKKTEAEELVANENDNDYMKHQWESIKDIVHVKYFFEKGKVSEDLIVPVPKAKKPRAEKKKRVRVKITLEKEDTKPPSSSDEPTKEESETNKATISDKEPSESSTKSIIEPAQPVEVCSIVKEAPVIKEIEPKTVSETDTHSVHNNKKKKRKDNQTKKTEKEYKELKDRTYKYFLAPTGSFSITKKQEANKAASSKKPSNGSPNGQTKHSKASLCKEEKKVVIVNQSGIENAVIKGSSDNHPTLENDIINNEAEASEVLNKLENPINIVPTTSIYEPLCFSSAILAPYINNDKGMEKLSQDIKKAVDELEAYNNSLYPVCEGIRKVIETQAAKAFSNKAVQAILYGSASLGLALESSDVDITLTNLEALSSEGYLQNLLKFGQYLETQDFVEECKVITTARVPVIKLVILLHQP